MLDNDALNLVSDVIKAIHGVFQMLVDFAAADELKRIPALDLLIKQLKSSIVSVVGVPLDARDLQANLDAAAFFATSGSKAMARCASCVQSTTASANLRISGSKSVISNNMMALAVALH